MGQAFDLSSLKKETGSGPSFETLSEEEQAQVEALAEKAEQEDEGVPVRTAFLVLLQDDGSAMAVADLDFKVKRDRIPSQRDMFNAASQIVKDINSIESAHHMVALMQQVAMQQAQQMQAQQIAEQLQRAGLKRP